ncbi:TetR/AcrR family transcriptional regulator [Pelagicoccus albus]|uniref:TetR/AcrR family transcriptional regulator n=1 Tax=Pelagicoccus albus TaxID=415222 RepID=A0A7X1B959_9BACT|nr:TetR/AcrR family transcriptional regulator [Pelagicoccus albus]MBC2607861.1 TetR/AcrR family transcriptional regulator [Pelagicoccus albus]
MKTANPELIEQRRQQVLEAARICFEEKGFHGASMSAICKQAKMSPGHLYHYFKGKEELIESLVENSAQHYEERLASLVETGDPLDAMLERAYEIWEDSTEGFGGRLLAELKAEASRNPKVQEIIRGYDARLHERFAKIIRFGQSTGTISKEIDALGFAVLIVSCIDGLRIAGHANGDFDLKAPTETLKLMVRKTLAP